MPRPKSLLRKVQPYWPGVSAAPPSKTSSSAWVGQHGLDLVNGVLTGSRRHPVAVGAPTPAVPDLPLSCLLGVQA
jgi:hypothetical protein